MQRVTVYNQSYLGNIRNVYVANDFMMSERCLVIYS